MKYLSPSLFLLVAMFFVSPAQAATFIVNSNTPDTVDAAPGNGTCADAAGNCTLRAAVMEANSLVGSDVIDFDFGGLINLTIDTIGSDDGASEGDLDITEDLTIQSPSGTIDIDQLTSDRVFQIPSGVFVVIGQIRSIGGGAADGSGESDADGGGIRNSGLLLLIEVRVNGNSSQSDGGGIYNTGTVYILNSLIDGNSTSGSGSQGAGIYNLSGLTDISNCTITNNVASPDSSGGGVFVQDGTVNLNNVTISDNTAGRNAGGIETNFGSATLRNTIIANNISGNSDNEDVFGAFISNGNNLVDISDGSTGFGAAGDQVGTFASPIDPLLGPLANNGGLTLTRAFASLASPAINAGNNCVVTNTCGANGPPVPLTTDQRVGFPRQSNGTVDIGAFEALVPTSAPVSIAGRVVDGRGRAIARATLTLTAEDGQSRETYTNSMGYYSFSGVPSGATYILGVQARRHTFATPTLTVSLSADVTGANFVASGY